MIVSHFLMNLRDAANATPNADDLNSSLPPFVHSQDSERSRRQPSYPGIIGFVGNMGESLNTDTDVDTEYV